ncbi:MAG TPA: carboxypeptidase-like regulatory domain-containing protein, partial [Planctomycetota bacterium]|nr:carboxypeptidase-like regulatory domain-containing protein [Planctomycetota bacterium]
QLGGLVALTGGEGRWKGSRPAASDVYVLFLDNKSDMVQLACRRGVLAHEPKIEFELSSDQLPQHWFEGRLVDERLQPLAGRRVEVFRVDADGLIVRRGSSTSADGRFRIGPLPPGDYELRDAARPPRVLTRRFLTAGQGDLGDVTVRAGG